MALCTILVLTVVQPGASAAQADTLARAAQPEIAIDLVEKGTDVFYLRAELGDAERDFLLDTGSGYLAISERELERLQTGKMAQYLRSVRARLASGKVTAVPIYRIASLVLGGCVLRGVEAAILPGASRNIIGMNVLKRVGSFSVSFNPAKLVIRGCGVDRQAEVATL